MPVLKPCELQRERDQASAYVSFDRCAFSSQFFCKEGCLRFSETRIKKIQINQGAYIFRAGDPFANLYILKKGFAKLDFSFEDGNSQIARFQIPGDYFGLVGAASGVHRFSNIALTDVELCTIDRHTLGELITTNPQLNQMIQDGMSARMASMAEHFYYLSCYSVERRLAKFLVDFQDRLKAVNLDQSSINLPMSREDLKSYLGTTSESLSRAFSSLAGSGCFNVQNRLISDIDFELLQKVADNEN
ncbi:helix-turn-helix domain-containing protein [Polynucleobacter sp. HIN8]|uniref:Crp/Fnr family transcriptional regulator n=1 Tax=Polynucleobacter sp. HIN8 TaxID=3047867 RepID=UPI0025748F49|nr:Crp/Fnr family transcriptional regulator [Polynucleobacter sp. HIN8]BEI38648.1 helix-turn-helix domain-containing protein [Polynucleobacter sp. HIN8]